MQVKIISKPDETLLKSLVDLENDIIPPFHQRCAIVSLGQGQGCLVVLPRESHCWLDATEVAYKGLPTAAATRHNVRRIRPEDTVAPGHSVIIIYRKEGKVLCGIYDPEFSMPAGSQLYQVASEGTLSMVDLVKAALV